MAARLPKRESSIENSTWEGRDGAEASSANRDWLLEVATALQTTLEIDPLLQLFSDRVRAVVPHDGMEYRDADGRSSTSHGHPAEHSVSHRLVLFGRDLGELRFTRSQPFDNAEAESLGNLLANLVHPLRNALMYRDALNAAARDPLTGLNNRATLESVLDRELELVRRHHGVLSVLMIDVDHFKSVNERYGHLVGDVALQALAQLLAACSRDSDMAFRFGGEEFVVVLSSTGANGAEHAAERIRQHVIRNPVMVDGLCLNLSVSIGVATCTGGDDRQSLLSRADQGLYLAKNTGRNRVVRVSEAGSSLGTDLAPRA